MCEETNSEKPNKYGQNLKKVYIQQAKEMIRCRLGILKEHCVIIERLCSFVVAKYCWRGWRCWCC